MKVFRAPNGTTLTAKDEVQASAFKNKGLKLINDDQPTEPKKNATQNTKKKK
jgi:hypothetical protein